MKALHLGGAASAVVGAVGVWVLFSTGVGAQQPAAAPGAAGPPQTFGTGLISPAGRMSTWRGLTPLAGPTMPSRSMRSMILAALL